MAKTHGSGDWFDGWLCARKGRCRFDFSLFGCFLRQGHVNFDLPPCHSHSRHVRDCWHFWQQTLATNDIHALLELLRARVPSAKRAVMFKAAFKKFAVAHLVDQAVCRLHARVLRNGWTGGPSPQFIEGSLSSLSHMCSQFRGLRC